MLVKQKALIQNVLLHMKRCLLSNYYQTKVDLVMTAVMGQGKDHTKWTPALAITKRTCT